MYSFWLTILGVAAAVVIGGVLGDRLGASAVEHPVVKGFTTAVMLAVVAGVLLPMLREQWIWVLVLLALICFGDAVGKHTEGKRLGSLLLVAVIALHHFPEGLAAGLSCRLGEGTWAVCGAVVLHSIPETMAIFPAVKNADCSRRLAWIAAAVSGIVTILGVAMGFCL